MTLLSWKCVIEVEGWELEELVEKPGTTIGTKFSVLQIIRIPSLMRCCFLTIDPFVRNTRFHRKAFRATILLACSRGLSVKNISNSLTCTVASSCVCTSPLAVMTTAGLHDFVTISISASFKSFLLTICIDAPEWTTNSRSSGLRVEEGRHPFSESKKNVALFFSFSFWTHFWPASTLHRGHLAHATLSPPETDPQILGPALMMRFTWANVTERRILVSNVCVTCNSFFFEFYIQVGSVSACLSSSVKSMKTSVAPYPGRRNPIVVCLMSCAQQVRGARDSWHGKQRVYTCFFNMASALLSPFFLNLLLGCSSTWRWSLFPRSATTLGLLEQAFWRMPLFTEWIGASSFEAILARPSKHSTTGTSGSRWFSLILLHERIWRRIRLCHFCTLVNIVTETAIVSFGTLPVGFPLPTISKNSLYTLFCSLILDHGVLLKISIPDSKVLISNFLLDTSFHHSFQSVIIRS